MEHPIQNLHIKKENPSEEFCSPRILAAKVYCISELLEQNVAGDSNTELNAPKLEVRNENDIQNSSDYEPDAENYYDNLFTIKEEFDETKFSDNEFIDNNLDDESPCSRDSIAENKTKAKQNKNTEAQRALAISSKTLLCPFCGIEYPKSSEWRDHVNSVHQFNKREHLNMEYIDNKRAKCKTCGLELSIRMEGLQKHIITHLPYKLYVKCKLCDLTFARCASQQKHFTTIHGHLAKSKLRRIYPERFVCPINVTLLCPACGIEFSSAFDWRNHINDIHELNNRKNLNMDDIDEIKARCRQCKMVLGKNLQILQRHRIRHLPFKLYYKCKLCDTHFATSRGYAKHIEVMHASLHDRGIAGPSLV